MYSVMPLCGSWHRGLKTTMLLAIFLVTWLLDLNNAQIFNCDPCVDRAEYRIRAIVHGTKSDEYWQQIEAAMLQAGKDMRVDLRMDLYDAFDESQMASDIVAASTGSDRNDAIIVTVPSQTIREAVSTAVGAGTPVFGIDSGYEDAESLGILGFVAMDERLAGENAANQFRILSANTTGNAVYVNPDEENSAFTARHDGFEAIMQNTNVDKLVVDMSSDITSQLNSAFQGCPYSAVLLASSELLQDTVAAFESNSCDFSNHFIGTFGTNSEIYAEISAGRLAFTVSQQQYLQGALSVVMASLYATTGNALAPSSQSEFGTLLSGPSNIPSENLPSDTLQSCEKDSFPICPNNLALDGASQSECGCIERKNIRIAGVLHAVTTDAFWDIVYSAAEQAADDFGVDLELDRFEPDRADVLFFRMAEQIEALCVGGVDGIFVTILAESVLDSIRYCQSLNIPVISINAGPDFSKSLGLYHHIGMVEFNAGKEAGKRMIAMGQMTRALCLMHAPDNVVLTDRCGGFQEAIEEAGNIEFLGSIGVPEDNDARFRSIVENHIEDNVDDPGDWTGIGILLAGQPQVRPGLPLKDRHAGVLLGAFDTSDLHYKGIDEGKLLFGLSQGEYLQGYLPIPLLAWQAYTKQQLENQLIETGPDFIVQSPSADQQVCEANHFAACPRPQENTPATQATQHSEDDEVENKGAIIAVSVIAAVCFIGMVFLSYRMYTLKKHVQKLERDGQPIPRLSACHFLSSAVSSVDDVVKKANADVV